uniref:Uncharacterized protein n=1 Tax=Caenorhabditis japonica TaxID=281687 RepID=A0A8R1HT09_CAEJA
MIENSEKYVHSDSSTNIDSETELISVSSKDVETETQQSEEIEDTNNYVFLIFLMLGFGALLPWNMFLNISYDYYTMFKLRENHRNATWFSSNFQNAMTISAQLPSLAFSVANIFFATKGDLTNRMKICLAVVQAMVVFTIVFIYINTSSWIGLFFVATIISIIVLNAANGLFQNCMFGLASPFPFKYTNAIIIGQNFCGTAVTFLAMVTKLEIYFMDVAIFLNFNLFAFLGSLMANWVQWPGPDTIWIFVAARLWFVFYFPAANYRPMGYPRVYPVLFHSTWFFVLNVTIFALSSGYLSSLIMMYAPRAHEEPQIQRMAGMLASFFLIFGIVSGLIASWQIRLFITGYAN